ncbi:hypothetical protein [Aquibacillus kalidii]|uniref:hypothetical protein n=1 Tax=Aquibacillus kalidii TaxID=2762597 RepID=UPI0016455107|nr:hypothetical protein [Aquibacillus kalidii]
MKKILLHIGYFMALIILSFFSFVVLLGAGFVGKLNVVVLLIPFIFSVLWLSDYTWRFMSMKSSSNKVQLIHPTHTLEFISLFITGTLIVYSIFLSTLFPFPSPEYAPSWMFLGTPVVFLVMWYWLLHRYEKNTGASKQLFLNSILLILSFLYIYQICRFYAVDFFQ